MKKKLLTFLLAGLLACTALSPAALAEGDDDAGTTPEYVAWIGETGYETLEAAITNAEDNATIQLEAGTFSTYDGVFEGISHKNLTFVGDGTDNTTWIVGAAIPRDGYVGEYDGDYSFDGTETLTFKNMTLQYGPKFYLGFIRVEHFVVEDCVVNGQITYGGTKTAVYKNTVFNAPANDYSFFLCDPTESMTFEGCTFNGDGKFINVYKDYGAGTYEVTINYSNCEVVSSKPNKSVLNIKDNNNTYIVNISGDNAVTGLNPDETTCSRLFQVEVTTKDHTTSAIVSIDGTTVWENGGMVSHAIDAEHDQYTDGYKDNAFTITESDWELQDDGSYTRTVKTVCDYCGYTETETETGYAIAYDLNGGLGSEDVDYTTQIAVENSEITVKPALTHEGYIFAGWNTAADGSETAYAAGDILTVEKDVTLYAQWQKVEVPTPTPAADPTPAPTPKDEHPEIAQAIKDGTWGKADPTPTPSAAPAVKVTSTHIPQTGDTSNPVLWATVMAVALAALAGVVIVRRRGE